MTRSQGEAATASALRWLFTKESDASTRGVKIDHYANGVCADCHNDRLVYAIDRPHSRG